MKYEYQLNILVEDLEKVLDSKAINYEEAKKVNAQCIYIVRNSEEEIVYVGKTGRTGKLRLREMSSDFRSHTLNRKLLKLKLEGILEEELKSLQNRTKNDLIISNRMTLDEFKNAQQDINIEIKNSYSFILYEVEQKRLNEVEHFLISVFKPKYND